jgi:hypothetical protein
MKNIVYLTAIAKENYRLVILLLFSIVIGMLVLVWDSLAFSCAITIVQHILLPHVSVRLFIGNRDINLENRLISGVIIGCIFGLVSAISLMLIENIHSPIFGTQAVTSEFTLLIYISYVVLFTCASIFFAVIGVITMRQKKQLTQL